MVMKSIVQKQLPRCHASFASIAFQMLENQSQLIIDRVFDESRPYMTKSMNRKVEELSIVSRAARSLSLDYSRGMGYSHSYYMKVFYDDYYYYYYYCVVEIELFYRKYFIILIIIIIIMIIL